MNSRIFKRIGAVLLFVMMLLGITGIPVHADGDEYFTVEEIQDAINSQTSTYIVLKNDIFADSMLIIPEDKDVTLILNGYSLMRYLESPSEDGSVIYVEEGGKLTLDDNEGEGEITGGYAVNGGGIYMAESGVLNLYGGSITENTAAGQGGGILVNEAAGNVNVKSNPVVTGNTAAKGNNIYLRDGQVLNIAGELEDGAALRVLLSSGPGTITANYSDYNGEDQLNFFQSDYYYASLVLKDGEVATGTLTYLVRTWENNQIKETRETVPEEGVNNGLPDGSLSEGWYIVGGTVTKTDRITISGTVNLILVEGCVLNAEKGIVVPYGSTLKIWARSDDSGKIIATGADEAAGIGGADESQYGNIEIHGGTITATGATYGAGIGSAAGADMKGSITISGGTVTANGGYFSAGIGSSSYKIDESAKYYLTDDNKVNDHKYKFTVMLSSIQLADKITPVFKYDSSDAPLQIDGEAHSVQDYIENAIAAEKSGKRYMVSVTDIYASDLTKSHEIKTGDCTINVSAMSYVHALLEKEGATKGSEGFDDCILQVRGGVQRVIEQRHKNYYDLSSI